MKIEEYELGYTPNNLKKLIFDNGEKREFVAEFFDLDIRQIHRWCVEIDNKNHQVMSHKRWVKLTEYFKITIDTDVMTHKGYVARIKYDSKDKIFVGHLEGINDIVGFHGTSVDELESAFKEAVDNYLEISIKTGRTAEKPL